MARSTTWASTVVADEDSMERIGRYDYCSEALSAYNAWAESIAGSTYMEDVWNAVFDYIFVLDRTFYLCVLL